jgi:hypothetical protein
MKEGWGEPVAKGGRCRWLKDVRRKRTAKDTKTRESRTFPFAFFGFVRRFYNGEEV